MVPIGQKPPKLLSFLDI